MGSITSSNFLRRSEMEKPYTSPRNKALKVAPLSPGLLRSKSGGGALNISRFSTPLQDIPPLTSNTNSRSKSTTKPRICKEHESLNVDISQRKERANSAHRARQAAQTPSAWALSPGRSPSKSPKLNKPFHNETKVKHSNGGVSGVFNRYFRTKKASPIQEETFHQLRVLNTRLVQWRLVNARAETAICSQNLASEEKLFNTWLGVFQLRNSVVKKRIKIQKLNRKTKLLQVDNSEIRLLNKCARIEKRNAEAVTKLAGNFSTLSFKLPLVKGAKVDTVSAYETIPIAMIVMNGIQAAISKSVTQVEEIGSLLKELASTVRQEKDRLEELRRTIVMVASLEAQERGLRIHLIQAAHST